MKMKILFKVIPFALIVLGFSSCLKDDKIKDMEYGMEGTEANKIIELPAGSNHSTAFSLIAVDVDTVLQAVTVGLAAKEPAQEDITVYLTVENTGEIVDKWNNKNPANQVNAYPEGKYSFPDGLTVTIPKGSRQVVTPIKIAMNPEDMTETPLAIGFRIAKIEQSGYMVSGNYQDLLVRFVARSQHEGDYSFKSVITGGANTTTTEDTFMPTINLTTVSRDNIGGYFGGYTEYSFNEDGTVSVLALSDVGGSDYNAVVSDSNYNEETGDFYVKFSILNGGYTFEETAVKK